MDRVKNMDGKLEVVGQMPVIEPATEILQDFQKNLAQLEDLTHRLSFMSREVRSLVEPKEFS